MSTASVSPTPPTPSLLRQLFTRLQALGPTLRALGSRFHAPWPRRSARWVILAVALLGALTLPRLTREILSPGFRSVILDKGKAGPGEGELRHGLSRSPGNQFSPLGSDRTQQPSASPVVLPEGPGIPWGRRIIRGASLEVELADVDKGITRVMEIIEAAGGYIADTRSHTDKTGTVRASISAHLPPDGFARALTDLEGLGQAISRQISGQDVSEEFIDLEARVRNLERHEGQLLAFMGKAQKVADLLSLENELARVRGEIERLSGRIRFLKARTGMAMIQVSLLRAPLAAPSPDLIAHLWREVSDAFRDAWLAAFGMAAALAVLAARISPLAVPGLAAWALYRRWSRRRIASQPTIETTG